MNTEARINLLVQLGEYFTANDEGLQNVKERARQQNPWFTIEFINLALESITLNFLQRNLLSNWIYQYNIPATQPKSIGIVMSGNIPLVGFHDFLCVFVSGNKAVIKPSSKDTILIKHIAQKLIEWNDAVENDIVFAENLKHCDAYIATGSSNSSRYFDYYFGKYPSIIRRNKTSVAILSGAETKEELSFLADDIQQYFGMGCRNVSRLYVPEGYDFADLLEALKKYKYFADFDKYKSNFDYQLTLLIMNRKFYMTNDSVILTENEPVFAPLSQVNYTYYNETKSLLKSLQQNADVQCIVAKGFIPFGQTQVPSLTDYADGVDTMEFLKSLAYQPENEL